MLIGIVGKPSAGKSTFFRAATLAEAEIANYPFTTIKPNHGVGYVKVECVDKEFGKQCNPRFGYCLMGWRFVPVDLLDVAGLVPGAHKGLGKGNQFLDDLRQADVLIHVVDVSGSVNEKGEAVEAGSYDPAKDIEFLEFELDMWYLGILKKGWEKFARQVQQEGREIDKALGKQLSALKVTEEMAKEVINVLGLNKEKPGEWTDDELMKLAIEFRKRTKPTIIACNKIDVKGAEENFLRLEKEFPDRMMVRCSAEVELALREAAKGGLIKYIPGEKGFEIVNESGLDESKKKGLEFMGKFMGKFNGTGVQEVLDRAVFDFLKYFAVFPGGVNKLEDQHGNVLPDCFLMPPGSTALDFAYQIHTDIGDKFIRAINVKTKMTIGKEHKLKNRDVVEIVTRK
ncbi:redox-regulated ATPase YchF [Candidatus Woesearchaeota archaeon]|nr:redox-regulated ATPase YchF [Candidatus Woesearchaeota archaeon]